MKQLNLRKHLNMLKRGALFLFIMLLHGIAFAQNTQLKGTVYDGSKQPIPGVTVMVDGTNKGTITDFDGNFELNLDNVQGAVLNFSFVGFKTEKVPVDGKTNFNITLNESAIALNEVVAVGYGVMKKSDVTGATAGVKAEDVVKANTSSVNEALQGKMSGVVISSNSGAPGGDMKILIRGANSINGNNDPLVVIDGIIGGSLKELNPNDIASLEVLKDASSTAIYGSRGANGVILVTTKSGKTGDTKVSYNGFMGVQSISKKLDVMDATTYAGVVNEKRIAEGGSAKYTDQQIADYNKTGGTDWQDEVYQNALMQSHDMSVSGGTEKTRFLVSGQYLDQEGILKNSNYDRFSYRANLETELSDKLTMTTRISGYQSSNNSYNLKWPNGSISMDALTFEPTNSAYDENGEYTQSEYATVNNPIADYEELNAETKRDGIDLNVAFAYAITPKLTLKVIGGTNKKSSDSYRYDSKYTYAGTGTNGKASISNSWNSAWQNTNMLTYVDSFGDHDLNVTLVNEQSGYKSRSNGTTVTDFDVNLGYDDISLGANSINPRSSYSESTLMSYLTRVNYSYKDKYLLTAAIRADGSSKFADTHKWGYFPSASVAWRITQESFMQQVEAVSNWKLRASYGVTGNQAINPYQSHAVLDPGVNYPINGELNSVGNVLKRFDNPELTWETTSQYNVGTDIALFDGKLNFSVDYYSKKTTDLLLYVPVPNYTGFGTELRNVGSLSNKGWDLSLGLNLGNNDFKWNGTLTASTNKSNIIDLSGADNIMFDYSDMTTILEPGSPFGNFYGYKYEGVWKSSEAEAAAVYGAQPGDARFHDLNGDGAINSDDRQVIGNALPTWTLGFSNSFSYKNWDMAVLFTASLGNEIYNGVDARMMGVANTEATSVAIQDRWTPDNENSDIPAFSSSNAATNTYQLSSSRFIENGSFLRLKNLTVGYTFLSKNKDAIFSSIRLYAQGQNLFTITNYKGYDPEVSNGGGDQTPGYDTAPFPMAKVGSIGVNISF
ncbi:TonB-dependent receptor [Halosquirtibacter xylanolyticus]|uniref:SusC/RagA family TonB-linked outer membrane protein n=1 Tax=Halosquirtibacter xylanolyticus TaxID=3374599 RepID=UPI0037480675|nr:TonB-dependent receptor [Prolixibacteraceae bacterium]